MSIAFFDFFRKKPEKFSPLCKGMVLPLFQFAKHVIHELNNAGRNLVFNLCIVVDFVAESCVKLCYNIVSGPGSLTVA